jgi:acyl-CoA thioesterase
VHGSGWADAGVVADPSRPGRYEGNIAERWNLAVVPQGGIVAVLAARAMAEELGHEEQMLRTFTAVFAGQVALGPVEIDVTALRRGRTMSQLSATARNPGAKAGLTAIAVFGAERTGFEFTDLEMPDVPGHEEVPSFRDGPPAGVPEEFRRDPLPFWQHAVEGKPAIGHPPWEDYDPVTSERATWQRLDDPPLLPDGRLDPIAYLVLADMMPGAVAEKLGPVPDRAWFGPSADLTVHLFKPAAPGWLLCHNKARWAGDGYASVEMALWDPTDRSLVAYATQMMFFTFPEGWG